jgi:transposase-like protein
VSWSDEPNRRLAVLRHVEEVSGNVVATCRYYGISRQCYYGWLRRYEGRCQIFCVSSGYLFERRHCCDHG